MGIFKKRKKKPTCNCIESGGVYGGLSKPLTKMIHCPVCWPRLVEIAEEYGITEKYKDVTIEVIKDEK
jgi:hypothetical protein